jgi:hypothetical protein
VVLLLVLLALVALLPATASAQAPGEGPNPSLDQYVESIPTRSGTSRTRDRPPGERGRLSGEARRRLEREAGRDARALEDVTTSPSLGAPPQRRGDPRRRDGAAGGRTAGESDRRAAEPQRSAVPSAIDATLEGGSSTTLLLALLAATAAGMGALALARRRSRSS